MATIIYLDVEDEITTAAARIRAAGGPRVGMFVPFGSRVATSRINFRLLAREAQDAGRRLDIVAPDGSARALAAAAGLSVFASVAEYEAGLAAGDAPRTETPATGVRGGRRGGPRDGSSGVAAIGKPGDAEGGTGVRGPQPPRGPDPASGRTRGGARGREPQDGGAADRRSRRGLLVLLAAIVAVALGFAGVGAVLLLPSADITITPQMEPVSPVSLTVRADPTATAVDQAGLVIPATSVEVPLTTQGEFPATGKNVEETSATGQVTFDSINTVNAMPIPRGTRVSTLDGVTFATKASVTVPRATVSGTSIAHGFATVGVTAVAAGPKGNVEARAIDQVPSGLAALQVSVSNAAPTTGGSRTETPKITAADVKAATEKLAGDLAAQVPSAVAGGGAGPSGTTLFPATAALGGISYTPDPTSLAGKVLKDQATFTLEAAGTVSVVAVDEGPLQGMGSAAIRAAVKPGYQIDESSVQVTVSEGTVGEDGTVSYTIAATALQFRPLDATAVKAAALGKSAAEARAALAQYGRVELRLEPFWVTSVPTDAGRVTLTITGPLKPAASPAPGATAAPGPTTRPSKAAGSPKPASAEPGSSAPAATPVPSG